MNSSEREQVSFDEGVGDMVQVVLTSPALIKDKVEQVSPTDQDVYRLKGKDMLMEVEDYQSIFPAQQSSELLWQLLASNPFSYPGIFNALSKLPISAQKKKTKEEQTVSTGSKREYPFERRIIEEICPKKRKHDLINNPFDLVEQICFNDSVSKELPGFEDCIICSESTG